MKWAGDADTNNNPARAEWRIVYLDLLKSMTDNMAAANKETLTNNASAGGVQGSFGADDRIVVPEIPDAQGDYILEETLDANQSFFIEDNPDGKYGKCAPFFFEPAGFNSRYGAAFAG